MPSSRRGAVANHIKQHIGTRFNRFGPFGLASVRAHKWLDRQKVAARRLDRQGRLAAEKLVAPIAAPSGYSDALIVLGDGGVVVPLVRRWGISPVLGYLGAGAILGPLGLVRSASTIPVVGWFTISDAQNVAGIAALGVAFLSVPGRPRIVGCQTVGHAPDGAWPRRFAGTADERCHRRPRGCGRTKPF